VASRFRRFAELLELENANPFRVRAYQQAASTLERLPEDVAEIVRRPDGLEQLDAIPELGRDLAEKVEEICRTGRLGLLDAIQLRLPATLVALSALPGLGPARIGRLNAELGVRTPDALRAAIAAGALKDRRGFGPRLERRLAAALARPSRQRTPRADAEPAAQTLRQALLAMPGVEASDVAGSLRRQRPDVGDVDLVAAAAPGGGVTAMFARLPQVAEVSACGASRATVRLVGGLQADLLVVPAESYGAALLHFTGSKTHNIALRRWARSRGLKLNERGLFRGADRIAGRTEGEIYTALGLVEPPPWLRETGALVAISRAH
jgi:DNA polymerase (family X)